MVVVSGRFAPLYITFNLQQLIDFHSQFVIVVERGSDDNKWNLVRYNAISGIE